MDTNDNIRALPNSQHRSSAQRSAGRGEQYKAHALGVLMPATVLRHPLSGDGTGDIGMLTHILIGMWAGRHEGVTGAELTTAVTGAAHSLVSRTNTVTRFAVASQAASMALKYLLVYSPELPWFVHGVEVTLGNRVADIVWEHPAGALFIDEVKTGKPTSPSRLQIEWDVQTRQLAARGWEHFGDTLIGVRLLPLRHPSMAVMRTRYGLVPIDPTFDRPFREGGGL